MDRNDKDGNPYQVTSVDGPIPPEPDGAPMCFNFGAQFQTYHPVLLWLSIWVNIVLMSTGSVNPGGDNFNSNCDCGPALTGADKHMSFNFIDSPRFSIYRDVEYLGGVIPSSLLKSGSMFFQTLIVCLKVV